MTQSMSPPISYSYATICIINNAKMYNSYEYLHVIMYLRYALHEQRYNYVLHEYSYVHEYSHVHKYSHVHEYPHVIMYLHHVSHE